jgi:AcrR family transcriptional regulator
MTRSDLDWPLPPTVSDPAPATERRSWGKVSHSERFRRQRRDLLRSAAKIASGAGYEGTRVADIVAEAGLSKSTFYEHFGSKEDCFVELHRRASANMLRAAVTTAEANLDAGPEACLAAVIRSFVGYPDRDRRLADVFRTELGASEPAIRKQREENLRRTVELLRVLAHRLGTALVDDEVRLTAAVLVRGVTDVLADLRRDEASRDASLDALAQLGCRAFALETDPPRRRPHQVDPPRRRPHQVDR